MAKIIIMPKLGFNMSEGKLITWYKKEGDGISKGEPLFSIETDKTSIDIESTDDGIVRKLLLEEGEAVPVFQPIAIVGALDEPIDDILAEALSQIGQEDAETAVSQNMGKTDFGAEVAEVEKTPVEGKRLNVTPRGRRVAREQGIDLKTFSVAGTGWQGGICEADILAFAAVSKVKVTPVAQKMADDLGVALDNVRGTGAHGKILKRDVEVGQPVPAAGSRKPSGVAGSEYSQDGKEILETIPYSGVRRIIGERMSQSKFTAPHLYFTQKINLEKLLELRTQINAYQEKKTSVTDYIALAVVKALQKYPDMNSTLAGDKIIKYKTVNIGIAVASPTGLIVPVVRDAEQKGILQISRESSALFEKARTGKLTPEEYTGGTFTISNLGMFGIENFTAIVNPPESGILAISTTKDEPFVETIGQGEKMISIKPVMNITLSVDHRLIDGLLAAQFVTEIKKILENPIGLVV